MIYKYFGEEKQIEYQKLKNGLRVYVAKDQHRKNYHMEILVNYGSEIKEFVPLGEKEYITLPAGVAHFLEHKVFDMENDNAFHFFAKTGTYINASTNYYCTRYYIDGKNNWQKNFDFLVSMVMNPYFIEESIEKEKKIIAEEIKMYEDEALYQLDDEARKCFYQNLFQEKIAGSLASIAKINTDLLNRTYHTFYQPSNLCVIATGNVDMKSVLDVLNKNDSLRKAISNQPIIFKDKEEPKEVKSEYKLIENVNLIYPKMKYLFKLDLKDFPYPAYLTRSYLNLLFSYLFGPGSAFETLVDEKRLATTSDFEYSTYRNIYLLGIDAETEFADILKEEVDKVLEKITLSKEDFIRMKKIWFSVCVRGMDNLVTVNNNIVDKILKGEDNFDKYALLEEMQYEDLVTIIKQLDFRHRSFILMIPKKD